jgi:hypothetical protein
MKFIIFFQFLWVIFALLDPDPDCKSGSRDPFESGSGATTLQQSQVHICLSKGPLAQMVVKTMSTLLSTVL